MGTIPGFFQNAFDPISESVSLLEVKIGVEDFPGSPPGGESSEFDLGSFLGETVRRLPLFCHPSFLKDHSQCHNANFVWKIWSELPQSDDAIGPQTMNNESYWRQNMGV